MNTMEAWTIAVSQVPESRGGLYVVGMVTAAVLLVFLA
jgi:hypothetical protein